VGIDAQAGGAESETRIAQGLGGRRFRADYKMENAKWGRPELFARYLDYLQKEV
jgi:hypothetical protein